MGSLADLGGGAGSFSPQAVDRAGNRSFSCWDGWEQTPGQEGIWQVPACTSVTLSKLTAEMILDFEEADVEEYLF